MYCIVQGQISEHMFAPHGGYRILFIILQIFFATWQCGNWGISLGYSPVLAGVQCTCIFSHVIHLDQLRVRKIFDELQALSVLGVALFSPIHCTGVQYTSTHYRK